MSKLDFSALIFWMSSIEGIFNVSVVVNYIEYLIIGMLFMSYIERYGTN